MQRIWPEPAVLDDEALRACYAPDRSQPSLRLNFVSSLDGAVEVNGYSEGLSGDADQQVLRLLRGHADAVMVGAGTLRQERYGPLRLRESEQARRRDLGLEPNPTLVVVSSSLELEPDMSALADAPARPIVLTHAGAPPDRLAALKEVADITLCGESVVDVAIGLADLNARGLSQVLCEGGPHLFGALLAADLVDELCLTISPLLAGAGAGRIVAGSRRSSPERMRLIHLIAAGDVLLSRYGR